MDLTHFNPGALLDSTWTTQAMELFADELHDLESLEKEEDLLFQAELQRMRDRPPETVTVDQPNADQNTTALEKKETGNSKKNALLSKRNLAGKPSSHVSGSAAGKTAFTVSTLRNASRLTREETNRIKARDEEFWQVALRSAKQQAQHAREVSELHSADAQRQEDYFSAHDVEEYTMDDVLRSAPKELQKMVSVKTRAATQTIHHTGDEICNETDTPTEEKITMGGPSSRPMSGGAPPALTTTSKSSLHSTLTNDNESDGTLGECEFIIDAVAFANDLNAVLEKEYGFRPMLTRSPEKGEDSSLPTLTLQEKLFQHSPGDTRLVGAPWSSTLPSLKRVGNEKPHKCQMNTFPTTTRVPAKDDNNRQKRLLPLPNTREGEKYTPVTATDTTSLSSKRTHVSSSVTPLECTAVNNCVRLQTTAGLETSTVVRFINRDPNRLRLRLRPSNHTWITYSIVNSSLGAASLVLPSSTTSSLSLASPSSTCTTISAPLVCGGFIDIQITFEPQNPTEPSIEQMLQLGYCREVNSRRGEGGKWNFFDVVIICETILPQFRLIPMLMGGEDASRTSFPLTAATPTSNTATTSAGITNIASSSFPGIKTTSTASKKHDLSKITKEAVRTCEFPHTLLMTSYTRWFYLENTGSDAIISLRSSSPHFRVIPTPETTILLPGGDRVEIAVCFFPMEEANYETEKIFIVVRDFEDGPIVAEHHFGLRGEGVLPHVELVRIGSLELSSQKQEQMEQYPIVPQYLVPDTTLGVETEILVELRNTCPVPLPYYWLTETSDGDCNRTNYVADKSSDNDNVKGDITTKHHSGGLSGVRLRVTPATGVLAPHTKTSFRVYMQPSRALPLAAVVNIFLEGLPEPPEIGSAVFDAISPLVVANVMAEYSRQKTIPALPNHNQVDQMSDPYCVFQHCSRVQPEANKGVFATGFYLFADPIVPSLVIVPDHLEEGVECLVQYENVRRITLQNNSSRPLHFLFDPKPEECPPGMVLSTTTEREDIEVKFQPRSGCVKPNSSRIVTFYFILRAVDHFSLSVDCYIPELVELLGNNRKTITPTSTTAVKLGEPSTTHLRCTHQIHLSVTGVGPSVRTSTDFLDFGLIEEGREGEASFTVTNDNPIPIFFNLQDPMMREPCRFVFLPPSFRLAAGRSVEVTVYRQAVEASDSQTFFELVVCGGGTIAIETRATIQKPLLVLEEAVVNFGVVPSGVWVEENFILSNTSAFDIPYTVEPALVSPYLQLSLPPSGVVQAGHHGVSVPIRCVFTWKPDDDPYKGLLRISNGRAQQQLLLEVCCDTVQQLAVSLDLIPIPKVMEGSPVMAYTPPVLPYTLPPPPVMNNASYIEALLWNLVEVKVLDNDVLSGDKDSGRISSTTGLTNESANANTLNERKHPPPFVLRPYCPPVTLKAHLPDWEVVWSELMVLRLRNITGCQTTYSVEAMCYTPETMADGTGTDMERTIMFSTGMPKSPKMNASTFTHQYTQGGEKGKGQQQQHGNYSPLSTFRGMGKGNKTTVKTMGTEKHAFWCKSVDATEQHERERRAALVDAQQVLFDGRGCATVFGVPSDGSPKTHDTVVLPLSICANLPGVYEETLRVCCSELPPTQIPVRFELTGRPLLFDSTTPGYKVTDGKQVLLMPSVIAGLGRSRRTVSLVNRVPRDLKVSVNIFLTAMAFCVVAVDDSVEAGAVTLHLEPISEEQRKRESRKNGTVSARPAHFLLPCMSTKVVTLEFTPDATFVSGQACEREWRGGAIVTAEIAETTFNDSFLIDEFYRIHAAQYPAQRVFKTKRFGETEPAWMKSILRPITMLRVQQPLLFRPGVVKKSVIIPINPRELSIMKSGVGSEKHENHPCLQNEGCNNNNNNNSSNTNNRVSEDPTCKVDADEEEDEVRGTLVTDDTYTESEDDELYPRNQPSHLSVESIAANENERRALLAYITQRRLELTEQCKRYFIPTELELQARCGVAQLDVEPSSGVIRFPKYVEGECCRQSIRLSNTRCAIIDFLLELPSPSFRIVSAEFISLNSNYEEPEVDDEEFLKTQRALKSLKWGTAEERREARVVKSSERRRTRDTARIEIRIPQSSLLKYSQPPRSGTEPITVTRYRLRPYDAFDITLEYHVASREELDAILSSARKVETSLNIVYLTNNNTSPNDDSSDDHVHTNLQQSSQNLVESGGNLTLPLASPVTELRQLIPLAVTFASPSVECNPPMLWFRPWQLIHDGRPQPSYAQKIQLLNLYILPVEFEIVPRTSSHTTPLVLAPRSTTTGTTSKNNNRNNPYGVRQLKSRDSGRNRQSSRILTREYELKELAHYWDVDDNDVLPDVYSNGGCSAGEPKHETLQEPEEQLQQKPKESHEPLLMVDPSRFIITPLKGVIPAATRGGRPGVYEISVQFRGYANVRFEAVYDVLINSCLLESCNFLLRGDSRETEISS